MFALKVPEGSKTRGVQILSPVSLWVEKSSTVVIDSSIEQVNYFIYCENLSCIIADVALNCKVQIVLEVDS